jgi:putative transposase
LEFGHHLCADEAGVHVSDGGDRLVQPVRVVVGFCLEALDEALQRGRPEIFNTDQGSQFTSREYTGRLEAAGVAVSRDGRGRALDNVFVERLWRSVKYEDIYVKNYDHVLDLEAGLSAYFRFYDEERLHQSLDYCTPGEVYRAGLSQAIRGESP